MDVTQFRLIAGDFAAQFKFYRDVVGLKPQFDNPDGPYVAFKPEHGSAIALHDRTDLAGVVPDLTPAAGDRALLVLRVDDLDATIAELTERGAGHITAPVELDGRIRCAYLRDPERNLIELQQWLVARNGGPVPPAS
ncbi:VOC family protein [Labedaea rhizosphaerae]|uniref:Putative enzyme related to lactoylglutathione lyase n=1 Tax=Labedaea rhizosphaerae TaxID=598644 RepID=A0A4R6SP73_LABRH|nr:VOC family protein [Labedaea rhizosphaerae]TDQ05390.1 putative enzyme related to lactoylglutathione lyase [Labedaea rhizosphaerae]